MTEKKGEDSSSPPFAQALAVPMGDSDNFNNYYQSNMAEAVFVPNHLRPAVPVASVIQSSTQSNTATTFVSEPDVIVPMTTSSINYSSYHNGQSLSNSNNPNVTPQSTTTSPGQVPLPQGKPIHPSGAGHSASLELGRHPAKIVCPYCHQHITTDTKKVIGITVLIAFIILLLLFWPLCWLPFCMPSCYGVRHFCPKCRAKLCVTEGCCGCECTI